MNYSLNAARCPDILMALPPFVLPCIEKELGNEIGQEFELKELTYYVTQWRNIDAVSTFLMKC